MSKICARFDDYFARHANQIGALCLLLCRDRKGADYAAFQSLLRLGGAKDPQIGDADARMLLFSSAVRLCDDFYLKKMHRMPSRARLEAMGLHFPVTPALLSLMRLPFARRAALALFRFGFSLQEIAILLHKSEKHAQALIADPDIPGWEEALDSMLMTEDQLLEMSDRIYERFAERSVGVENAIHDLRNAFDRAAPFLALLALAICALAVWYVKTLA